MEQPPEEVLKEQNAVSRSKLEDIIQDRKTTLRESVETTSDLAWVNELPAEQQELAQKNIDLLSLLNGHKGADLRRVVSGGGTPEAQHVQNLLEWSRQLASGSNPDNTPLFEQIPPCLSRASETSLYEKIVFLEKYPETPRDSIGEEIQRETARALGIESEKWIDLINPLFNDPKAAGEVIDRVGFIPEELYTKKKFKSVDSKKIVALTDELRKLENSALDREALHERARVINHFFISRRAEQLRAKERDNVTLDSNGISVNLIGFNSHLPYGLIDDETITELERGNWMPTQSITEIRIQKAKSNNEHNLVVEIKEVQGEKFGSVLEIANRDSFFKLLSAGSAGKIAEKIIAGRLVIPDAWIESAQSQNEHADLVALAEEITSHISGEAPSEEPTKPVGYEGVHGIDDAYQVRSKILNDPAYYNVIKIVQNFLSNLSASSAPDEYMAFRGHYKKSREGDQHSFIETIKNGRLARVLINEDKHIPPTLKENLARLPVFDRNAYENLEAALRTFDSFSRSLARIELLATELTTGPQPRSPEEQDLFIDSAQNCLHFILTNVSEVHIEAESLYEKVKTPSPEPGSMSAFISLLQNARTRYAEFLYKNILSQNHFEERFSPEVKALDIQFGDAFIDGALEKCPKGYDEALSRIPFKSRVVTVDYKLEDPSETIPFHIEESCLDALRLNRNRPLINIIGGCKHLDSGKNPLETMSEAVVSVAHKHKANVGVPGTQSGIGTVFGKQNIHYQEHFDHLPHAEQAHFFSINPGGSVYFPGNTFIEPGAESVYANTTVDTLATPVPAEWNKKGLEKYTSKYLTHIAYMEALYHRMSVGQKHVMVVGNGGLYSIMEINESLKKNAGLILVKDTGRFAEAASALVPHLSEILASTEPDTLIIDLVKKTLDEKSSEEFFKKDFGFQREPENDDYKVYRDYFMKFLTLAHEKSSRISVTDLNSLQFTLDNALQP